MNNPIVAGCEDKRLEIDLEGLREYIWENADGTLKDYVTENQHDKIRWIDTSAMICDPLTKQGMHNFNQRLHETMMTGRLSLEASTESQMKKLNQQKARRKKAEDKELKLEEFEEPAYDDNTNMQMEDKD